MPTLVMLGCIYATGWYLHLFVAVKALSVAYGSFTKAPNVDRVKAVLFVILWPASLLVLVLMGTFNQYRREMGYTGLGE